LEWTALHFGFGRRVRCSALQRWQQQKELGKQA